MYNLAVKELKSRDPRELSKMLIQEQSKLRELRFKLAGAQVKNVQEIKVVKKNVARILTTINQNSNLKSQN